MCPPPLEIAGTLRFARPTMLGPRPLHQHVGLAFLVAAAVGSLDLAKAVRAVERDSGGVPLEHPEPQRCVRFHCEGEERLPKSLMVALRVNVEGVTPAGAERNEAVDCVTLRDPHLAFGYDVIAKEI